MNLELSYVPTTRERRPSAAHTGFLWLMYAGSAGAALAVFGIGHLSRTAASHGEPTTVASLAAIGGVLLLIAPLLLNFWAFQSQLRDRAERHITVTPSEIRAETEGVTVEAPWAKVSNVRETPNEWLLTIRNTCLVIPKRAVPEEHQSQLETFLRNQPNPGKAET